MAIETQLAQFNISLGEVAGKLGKLRQAMAVNPLASARPRTYTKQQAIEAGWNLDETFPEDYRLKVIPDTTEKGYSISFLSPDNWEIRQDDTFLSPEGKTYTREELKALETPAAPAAPESTMREPVPIYYPEQPPENSIQLPDGSYVDKAAAEKLRVDVPELYDVLTKQGYDAYQKAFEAMSALPPVAPSMATPEAELQKITQSFTDVFGGEDIQTIMQWMDDKPEEFINTLSGMGRNTKTETLVKTLWPEATEDELSQLWPTAAIEEVTRPDITEQAVSGIVWQKTAYGFSYPMPVSLFNVAGAYLEKYVGRPWEKIVLQARAKIQQALFGYDPLNDFTLKRLGEIERKYGWAGSFVAQEGSDIWQSYLEKVGGPVSKTLPILGEWLNPVYMVPVGGTFGLAAKYTSKIPLLGKVMTRTAAGVQAIEGGMTAPIAAGVKDLTRIGEGLGEKAAQAIIRNSKHLELSLELPETQQIIDGVIVDNWQKRALQIMTKVPVIKKGISNVLGYRILLNKSSLAVEDIVGRGAVAYNEIVRRGTNAASAKYWELSAIDRNPTKTLGFNDRAFSAKMADRTLPEFQGTKNIGTLEDVFTQPEHYNWTGLDKGLEYVTRVHEINTQVLELLKKEGVAPKQVIEDWIHRVVTGLEKPTGEVIENKKITDFLKHRRMETMADGIAVGVHYDPHIEKSISEYIQSAYRKIANARLGKYVEGLSVDLRARMVENYPNLFEQVTIGAGKIPGKDLIQVGEKWYKPKAAMAQQALADATDFNKAIWRAIRGEKLPEQTLKSIERNFPELGAQLRTLNRETGQVEKQLRELLVQNDKVIKGLRTQIETIKKTGIKETEALRQELARIKAEPYATLPDETKLREGFKVMNWDERSSLRSAMRAQLDEVTPLVSEQRAQLETLTEVLSNERANELVGLIKKTGKERGEFSNLTINQYRELFHKEPLPSILTKDGKHVRWEYSLDTIATEMGYTDGEALRDAVLKAKEMRDTIADLKELVGIAETRQKSINRIAGILDEIDATPEFIPKTEPGMPEAGMQADIFGYKTPVFPKGKGKITQISMEDYQKLAEYSAEQGQPLPELVVKPKVEGIPELSGETIIARVSSELPNEADRLAQLKALSADVKDVIKQRRGGYWQAESAQARAWERVKQPGIGEDYVLYPFAARGKVWSQEYIDAFNKFFGYEKGLGALKVTSDVSGILRLTKASLDFSAMAIQGLPSWGLAHAYMVTNPKIGVKLMGAWYKAFGYSVASFFDPGILARFVEKNPSVMQRIKFGGSLRAVDYFDVLGKQGWAAKGLGALPLKPFQRAEVTFLAAGEMVRDEFWKVLSSRAIKNGEEYKLARFLDIITGIGESKAAGVPLTTQQLEQSFAWFAPNYTRSCLSVIADIFRGGYTGAEARKAMGGMIAAGGALYSAVQYGIATIEGKSHDDAMQSVFEGFGVKTDPITGEVSWVPNANFMTVKVGNYNFGFGGFWYGMLRLAGNLMGTITDENARIDLVTILKDGKLNRDNPFIYWWYNRSAPIVGTVNDLVNHSNFLGYPIETPQQYALYIATRFEPIWMESGLNRMIPGMARDNEIPEGVARAALVPGQLFGLKINPESAWVKFYDKVNELAQHIPSNEIDPKQMDAFGKGKLGWKQLTDIQQQNLLTRYPELNDLYTKAQGDSAVRESGKWKQYNDRINIERETYYARIDELTRQLKNGEIDAKTYREKVGEAGQNYGAIMDSLSREPAYADIFDYFDQKDAEGDKYGFTDNLALAEYQTKILYAEDLNLPNGDYDWDERDKRLDAFIDKWGLAKYEEIRKYLSDTKNLKGLNPLLIRKAQDSEKLGRDYWRLPYKPISEMKSEDWLNGDIPTEYLAQWNQYQSLPTTEAKEAFIKANIGFGKDWRAEYRLANPEADATLALWGYGGKLQSREAYDLVEKYATELGIPFDFKTLGMPPRSLADNYFELNKIVMDTSGSSAEARLYKLDHPRYLAWGIENYGWDELKNESIDALRLRVQYKDLFTQYDAFGDKSSASFIEDEDKRREERTRFLTTNPQFNDDRRRIEIYELSNNDPQIIETYVGYGKLVDQYGAGSAEAKLFRLDNPALDTWGMSDKTLKWSDLKDEKIPVLRINARWRTQDDEYDAFGAPEAPTYIKDDRERAQARAEYLLKNTGYAVDRIRRDGYNLDLAEPMIPKWTTFNQLPTYGFWRDRYRKDNIDFDSVIKTAHKAKGQSPWADLEPDKIPAAQYDEIYEQFKPLFKEYENVEGTLAQRDKQRETILKKNPDFAEAIDRRQAYGLLFPDSMVENYVEYYQLPVEGYAQERYLKEHRDFYATMSRILEWKDPLDFSLVPTEKVENLFNEYETLATGKPRIQFRQQHPDLDAWLVLKKIVSKPVQPEGVVLSSADRVRIEIAERETDMVEGLKELKAAMED